MSLTIGKGHSVVLVLLGLLKRNAGIPIIYAHPIPRSRLTSRIDQIIPFVSLIPPTAYY
jgi:hypothetical protein